VPKQILNPVGYLPNCNDPKSNILVRRAPCAGQIWASKIPQQNFQIFVEKFSLLKLNKCKTVKSEDQGNTVKTFVS